MDCICKWLALFFDCALDGDKACLHDKMDENPHLPPRHCESFDVTIGQNDYNHHLCRGFFANDAAATFLMKKAGNCVIFTHDPAL